MAELEVVMKEDEKRLKAGGWSDLHPELLAEVFRRMDVVSYVRSLSVCASWRSIPERTMNFCKPRKGHQLPWLLIPSRPDAPRSRCFSGLSCFHTKMARYTLRLPQVAYHRCIGSSQGFLITVKDSSMKLCAMNPLTGARFPLPPTATHPDIHIYDDCGADPPPRLIVPNDYTKVSLWYRKAVISPSLDTIAVAMQGVVMFTERRVNRAFRGIAFARAGDDSWTALMPPLTWGVMHYMSENRWYVKDIIFHKGCLYVLYRCATLFVFNLENPAAPPLVSHSKIPKGPCSDLTLTETPDGEDLLVLRRNAPMRVSTDMAVFMLSKDKLEWNQVQGIGDVALFFDGEATRLCSTLHDAFYNWAIAISDRAKLRGRTKEAEELWKQATQKYEKAVQLNWNSPQALNNWGLALQELSAIVSVREKAAIVRSAISKFRAAVQLQFDFHRAIYNLGTVLYGLAEDTLRLDRQLSSREISPDELYSQSAIYIAAAHALKPNYSVYRSALRLVRTMLPLPYLKVGYLTAPPTSSPVAPHTDWERSQFVLNHEGIQQVTKGDKQLSQNHSGRFQGSQHADKLIRVDVPNIVCVSACADLTLPPGAGLCIDTIHGPVFLVADTWESLDGWLDAIRLVYTIFARGRSDVLAGILTG